MQVPSNTSLRSRLGSPFEEEEASVLLRGPNSSFGIVDMRFVLNDLDHILFGLEYSDVKRPFQVATSMVDIYHHH